MLSGRVERHVATRLTLLGGAFTGCPARLGNPAAEHDPDSFGIDTNLCRNLPHGADAAAILDGEIMTEPKAKYGCNICREALQNGRGKADLETVHAELRELGIARIQFYQNDTVVRCKDCGATWLSQFWEYDTEETRMEEWGITERKVVPMPPDHLAELEAAMQSGTPLPHDHFLKRWS